MSNNYYDMQKGKVKIAEALMKRGWTVYNFKEDDSDSMTDYYSPAHWFDGVATKNGFVLVVDNSSDSKEKELTKYNPAGNLSFEDKEKITKLEAMTVDNGATEGEEQNAKKLIEKIKGKVSDISAYEVIGIIPAHMGNPGRCKWHIEKDGKLYDKGTGIIKFSDVPSSWEYDINKMEYTQSYRYFTDWDYVDGEYQPVRKERELPEETRKIVNDFKALILRFERVVNGMNSCGDGTKETEQKAQEQQEKTGFEKVTEIETKTTTKPVEVTDRKIIMKDDILTFAHGHSGYWQVIDIWQNSKGVNCYTYEILGSEKRGYQRLKNGKRYYQTEPQIMKSVENGNVKIYTIQTVTESTPIEKWIKIDKTKKPSNSEPKKEQVKTENKSDDIDIEHVIIINDNEEQATSKQLWALHCATKLNTKDIKISKSKASELISKSKSGENITDELTNIINGKTESQKPVEQPTQNKAQETAETITEYSTDIIIELGLQKMEYITDLQYKTMLTEKLQNCNITITAEILNYIEYDGLKQVLQSIITDAEQAKKQEKYQAEKAVLLEKIDKNITSLQTKIDGLTGDYKVNTWKRQQEQASRDEKIESYTIDIKILQYVQTKLLNNEQVTELEKGLLVGAFRTEMHSYHNRKYGRYPQDIKFPCIDYSLPSDSWWNKEVPQMQNKLKRYGIANTEQLIKAVEEYKVIYDDCRKYESPIEQKIKNLTNQYKMQQKGDIHFTTNKELLNQLIDLAGVTESDIVLEPSAGIGCIADEIKKYTSNIDCCEYMINYSELLKLKGYKVTANDFLSYDKPNYYDKIIANVPFSDEQNHVKHIYECLKADGRAVIITSNHWTFANDRNSQEFRTWLNNLTYEVYDAPAKSFEFTNVGAKILVIYKDSNNLQMAM